MIIWTLPYESFLNATIPDLISSIAFATFGVTVPVLGFGIKPLGPKSLPTLPNKGIISGVATITS